jgi:hypothetical protein
MARENIKENNKTSATLNPYLHELRLMLKTAFRLALFIYLEIVFILPHVNILILPLNVLICVSS